MTAKIIGIILTKQTNNNTTNTIMKHLRHLLWLWLALLLAVPQSAKASDGFETDANFLVSYMGNGVIHFRLLFLDCGNLNYYMTRKDGVRSDGVLVYMTYNDASGTKTVNAFQLYCPSNPKDGNEYADMKIKNIQTNSVLVLTNPYNNFNETYGGQVITADNVSHDYKVKKSTGHGLKFIEFDYYLPASYAGMALNFNIDGPTASAGKDLSYQALVGNPVNMDKKPDTYISDPIFMPSGTNMGYHQMIISNSTGEKMKINKVTEVDKNGFEIRDMTSECKVDNEGYGMLLPARSTTYYAKVFAAVPYSKFQFVNVDTKNVKLSAFHNAEDFNLGAAWAKNGGTTLTWTIPNANEEDALSPDMLAIERQLYNSSTGQSDSWESLDQVVLEKGKSNYEYTDSTSGCYGNTEYNSVRYRVYRYTIGPATGYYTTAEMRDKRSQVSYRPLKVKGLSAREGKVTLEWDETGAASDGIKRFLPQDAELKVLRTAYFYRNESQEELETEIDITDSLKAGKKKFVDTGFAPCVQYEYKLVLVPNDIAGVMKPDTISIAPKMEPLEGEFNLTGFTATTDDPEKIRLSWEIDRSAFDEVTLYRQNGDDWEKIDFDDKLMFYDDYNIIAGNNIKYMLRATYECSYGADKVETQTTGYRKPVGRISGYVTYTDGTALPNIKVSLKTPSGTTMTKVTDATGYYEFADLPYADQYRYTLSVTGGSSNWIETTKYFFINANQPFYTNQNFVYTNSVDVDGYVYFEGTTVPVYGASFKLNGRTVLDKNGSPLISDNDGHFAFKVTPGNNTLSVEKEGHTFMFGGVYADNQGKPLPINQTTTNIFFWDQTKVRTIGRVVGGQDQGDKSLLLGKSKNNLGEDLRIVLELEGNQRSWLVKDQLDATVVMRRDTIKHEATTDNLFNRVTTERHRVVIEPNVQSGEYIADLLPTRYKVIEISAKGYPSLFQSGKVSEILDLTDSLATYQVEGDAKRTYGAIYSRIYRCEPTVSITEISSKGKELPNIGLASYEEPTASSGTVTVPLYDATSKTYTFGYPVLDVGDHYFRIKATENYYYNGEKTGICDSVPLRGGKVKIYDDFNVEQSDTLCNLSEYSGTVDVAINVGNTVYDVEGTNALRHLDVTLEHDGQFIDGQNLNAFVMGSQSVTDDVVSADGVIQLQGVLRDPPGSKSYSWIDQETTYQSYFKYNVYGNVNLSIGVEVTKGVDIMTGAYAGQPGTFSGTQTASGTAVSISPKTIPIIGIGRTYEGNSVFKLNERLQTSSDPTEVGADADIYYGYELVAAARCIRNVRAINESTYRYLDGLGLFDGKEGSCHLIQSGRSAQGIPYYLISDYDYQVGPKAKSTFHYTQKYITNTLIPKLTAMRNSYIYKGTREEAQAKANATLSNVFFSLRDESDPRYAQDNLDDSLNYISIDRYDEYRDRLNYEVITPEYVKVLGLTDQMADRAMMQDSVRIMNRKISQWQYLIALNEYEKASAIATIDRVDRSKIDFDSGKPYDSANANFYLENHSVSGGTIINHNESMSTKVTDDWQVPIAGYDVTEAGQAETDKFLNNLVSGLMSIGSDAVNSAAKNIKPIEKKFAGADDVKFVYQDSLSYSISRDNLQNLDKLKDVMTNLNGKTDAHVKAGGFILNVKIMPQVQADYNVTNTENTNTTVYRGYQLETDPDSHLSVDVYHDVTSIVTATTMTGKPRSTKTVSKGNYIFRTLGGATRCPYEKPELTKYYATGTTISNGTAQVEKPRITVEKHIISGVPYGETAKFNLVLSNEGTVREQGSFDLVPIDATNQLGAALSIDGAPLGSGRSVVVPFGTGMVKVLEIGTGLVDDYENIRLALRSQCDPTVADTVSLSVHFTPTASPIAVITPQNKWVLNTNSAQDSRGRYYLPVSLNGYDVNFRNFDHIELQYKQTNEPESRWTNLCSYYSNDSLYALATGTKAMITGNSITTSFLGDSDPVELNYDLRAVTYSRLGNDFVTNNSGIFSGIKDTRRPAVFGSPLPANNILGIDDDLKLVFSEPINANRLLSTNNFKVTGIPNNTDINTSTTLMFTTENGYLQTEAERNLAGGDFTIDMRIRPDFGTRSMELFHYGPDNDGFSLFITPEKTLSAQFFNTSTGKAKSYLFTTRSPQPVDWSMFRRVVMTFKAEEGVPHFYIDGEEQIISNTAPVESYTGKGVISFGKRTDRCISYRGSMVEARLWTKALTPEEISSTDKSLYGYEVDLCDYYSMNEGIGTEIEDKAQGATLQMFNGVAWTTPKGHCLRLAANNRIKLNSEIFSTCTDTKSFTLGLWFKAAPTDVDAFAIMASGMGDSTEFEPRDKFFIGVENQKLTVKNNTTSIMMDKSYCDDLWHQLTFVVDRTANIASTYVDGQLTGQTAAANIGSLYGEFYLGASPMRYNETDKTLIVNKMTGLIDEITLWDMALPKNIIRDRFNQACDGTEPGLLAYIPFSEQEQLIAGGGSQTVYSTKYYRNTWDTETQKFVVVKKEAFDIEFSEYMKTSPTYAPIKEKGKERDLRFNFITKDNELIIALAEPAKDIERTTVNITALGIEDLNGNEMLQPVQWSAFINRNVVRWNKSKERVEIPYYQYDNDYTFTITASNKGGAYKDFTIEGAPSWITIEEGTEGTFEPEEELTFTITISKDINFGTYDEVLYLRNDDGLVDPLALTIVKTPNEPDWSYNKGQLRNMQICAQVKMADAIVNDKNNIIAAFDYNNNCLGTGHVTIDREGKPLLYLTIYGQIDAEHSLQFRMWDSHTGITYKLSSPEDIYYVPDTICGSYTQPVIFSTTAAITQEIELEPTWTWISLNVLSPLAGDINKLLKRGKWIGGDQLKDPETKEFYNYDRGTWYYSKSGAQEPLDCERMYFLKSQTVQTLSIEGEMLTEKADRTIDIHPGWNYIGYTPIVNVPLEEALADFYSKASEGDIIKSQDEFAYFHKATGWKGNLLYMKPGRGYMLYHSRSTTSPDSLITFTYPYKDAASGVKSKAFNNAQQDEPLFKNHKLTTMNMILRTEGVTAEAGDLLYAYADGELCGLAEAQDEDGLFYMSVGGEKASSITFTLERNGQLIGTAIDAATYKANTIEGTPDHPATLRFGITAATSAYEPDVWYTVSGIRLGQNRPTTPGIYLRNGVKEAVRK